MAIKTRNIKVTITSLKENVPVNTKIYDLDSNFFRNVSNFDIDFYDGMFVAGSRNEFMAMLQSPGIRLVTKITYLSHGRYLYHHTGGGIGIMTTGAVMYADGTLSNGKRWKD